MPPKKIAFLFLIYSQINFEYLWHRFFNQAPSPEYYSVYIHAKHPKYIRSEYIRRHLIPFHYQTNWGGASLVLVMLALLAFAHADPDNYKFIFVSDSCIPLKTFKSVYHYLTRDENSYINWWRDKSFRKDRVCNNAIQVEHWAKSSQWIILNRRYTKSLIDNRHLLRHFWGSFCPDEHFVPTVLSKLGLLTNNDIKRWSKTYVNWGAGKAHPRSHSVMEKWELRKFIDEFYLFGRKFPKGSDIGKYWSAIIEKNKSKLIAI